MRAGTADMAPIVKITELQKYFDRLHVLKGINLDVEPKEVVCVIGRSGSGKSTLLRCINFLEEPSFGTIEVDGFRSLPGIRAASTASTSTTSACGPAWSSRSSTCFRT